jgi:hypothetical protein
MLQTYIPSETPTTYRSFGLPLAATTDTNELTVYHCCAPFVGGLVADTAYDGVINDLLEEVEDVGKH